MTGDELNAFVKCLEVKFSELNANIYEFPSGRRLEHEDIDALLELEKWEKVLTEW